MKRKIYTLLSVGIALLSSFTFNNANAQNQEYWRENFDGTGPTSDPSSPGPVTVVDYIGTSGTWRTFGIWLTTGTACNNSRHIRSVNFGNSNPTDSAYVVTPRVGSGIMELRFNRSRPGRGYSFYKTTDTAITTTNWVFVTRVPRVTGFPVTICLDSAIMINDVNAKRIMIRFDGSGNSDIDSVALTSVLALPIKFGSINAQQVSGSVKVSWAIQTEINTLKYEIEKSTDGRNFSTVGTVVATNAGKYSWIDNSVSPNDSYYRIKGIDKDGAITYSTIVRVNAGKKSPELVITPNPVQGNLLNIQLSNAERGIYTMKLYNNVGALVVSNTITNEGGAFSKSVELPASVTKGVYQLQLINGTTRLSKTVIVQ